MPNMIVGLPTTATGSSLPVERSVDIANTGDGNIQYNITSNAAWLTPSAASGDITGAATQAVNFVADISGLSVGAHVGNVILQPINGTCASNGPFDIEVQLTVTA